MNDRLRIIKEKLVDPAIEHGDLDALQRAAEIWKATAEAEKAERETAQLGFSRRSESVRFWVPVVAPLVTALALIATLILQVDQFKENTKVATQTAEDTTWKEAVEGAASVFQNPVQAVYSIMQMKAFKDSPRYSGAAREITVEALGHSLDPSAFRSILNDLSAKTTWENLKDLIRLDVLVNENFQNANKIKRLPADQIEPDMFGRRPSPAEAARDASALGLELRYASAAIVSFLRENVRKRAIATNFDDTQFSKGADVSDLDFSGCSFERAIFFKSKLANAVFADCSVARSEFDDISEFNESKWERTAWWRAASINMELLTYLIQNYPFEVGEKYRNDQTKDAVEYNGEVLRLEGR